MSAPPVLRPLRAILQRRLQTVPSRPIRTPYYLRAPYYRSQLRCNSSIPPDQPPKPQESAREAPSEQNTAHNPTSTTTHTEGTQSANVESSAGFTSVPGVEAQASVATDVDISGQDVTIEAGVPRLDNLLVKSAFQQLKSTDAEIQAGIAEAVARQLVEDVATTTAVDEAAVGFEEDASAVSVPLTSEPPVEEVAEVMENQPEPAISQRSASLQSKDQTFATAEAAKPTVEAAENDQEAAPQAVGSEEAAPQQPLQQAATPKKVASDNAAPQQAAVPGLEALKNASPEQIAAMMAYLQTLQAQQSPTKPAEIAPQEAPMEEQQKAADSVVAQTTTPISSSAETVASMTEPAEPAQLEAEMPQAVPEIPAYGPTPTEDNLVESTENEGEFFVEPIPDTHSPEEAAIMAMTQEFERLHKEPGAVHVERELPFVPEPHESAAVTDAPKQFDTLESAVAAERSAIGAEEPGSVDSSLKSVLEEELEKRDREEHAEDLAKMAEEAASLEASGETGKGPSDKGSEPSRIPRNVAAYYLQPLRRVAEYGVPACDLQLRSYSIRPLESFCDFALRAAYYLGLPAYGPVPLPKIIERWTVPRSSFIFKRSQENFERITRRRLIQIKDAHPETVQIWLAFLQKHQQAAVGMKANLWEFSSIDVAKQLDGAFEEAQPLMNDKYRLLQQNKEFDSVEKVDEFLQAARYRVTGDQVERNQ